MRAATRRRPGTHPAPRACERARAVRDTRLRALPLPRRHGARLIVSQGLRGRGRGAQAESPARPWMRNRRNNRHRARRAGRRRGAPEAANACIADGRLGKSSRWSRRAEPPSSTSHWGRESAAAEAQISSSATRSEPLDAATVAQCRQAWSWGCSVRMYDAPAHHTAETAPMASLSSLRLGIEHIGWRQIRRLGLRCAVLAPGSEGCAAHAAVRTPCHQRKASQVARKRASFASPIKCCTGRAAQSRPGDGGT